MDTQHRSHRSGSRSPAFVWAAGISLAACLSGCLSDGPNRTVGPYAGVEAGAGASGRLMRAVLTDVTVDSVATQFAEAVRSGPLEYGEAVYIGEHPVTIGRWGGFSAGARFLFALADTSYLAALRLSDSSLRFSLSLALEEGAAKPLLEKSIADFGRSSDTLIVETWVQRTDLDSAQLWSQSLSRGVQRFVTNFDPPNVLDKVPNTQRVRDTIVIALNVGEAPQPSPLRNLQAHVQAAPPASKWLIGLEVNRIESSPGDLMLRVRATGKDEALPMLAMGDKPPAQLEKRDRIAPYLASRRDRQAFGCRIEHTGSGQNLLAGKTRGMHLYISRETILAKLRESLGANFRDMEHDSLGQFSTDWFVPYAELTLHLDSTRLEAEYPIDIRLASDIDSLPNGMPVTVSIPPSTMTHSLVDVADPDRPWRIVDSLRLHNLGKDEEGVLRIAFLRYQDASRHDTMRIARDGKRIHVPKGTNISFTVENRNDSAVVSWHISLAATGEPRDRILASTGQPSNDMANNLARLLRPDSTKITMRATLGTQMLLNRTGKVSEPSARLAHDFFIIPDKAVTTPPSSPTKINFPVFGEIHPALSGGKPKVDMVIYLYPLRRP